MHPAPFRISPHLRVIAAVVGGALLGAGVFLPTAGAGWLTLFGMVGLFLGGLGMKVPAWAAVRPLVPISLVPLILAASKALESPAQLPIPEEWKAYAPLAAGFLALLAGKIIPLQGTMPEPQAAPIPVVALTAAKNWHAGAGGALLLLLCFSAGLGGCTHGPSRATVVQALEAAPVAAEPTPSIAGTEEPSADVPVAGPFSVGVTVGLSYHPGAEKGAQLAPAQLLTGSLKLANVGQRSVNLIVYGGLQGTSVSEARAAWGFGGGFELTPDNLLYEVNATLGILWVKGVPGPGVTPGVSIGTKM